MEIGTCELILNRAGSKLCIVTVCEVSAVVYSSQELSPDPQLNNASGYDGMPVHL